MNTISVVFKKIMIQQDSAELVLTNSALNALIQAMVSSGNLTPREMTFLIIQCLQGCDGKSLSHVLPRSELENLIHQYELAEQEI